jgi:anti-anti-sigma factor
MEMIESRSDHVAVLALRGRLDTLAAAELEKRIPDLVRDERNLLIDLTGLEYISSSGLRAFLAARKTAKESGARMVLCGPGPEVMRIFDLAGFTSYFTFARSAEAALSLFAGESEK